MGDVWYRLLILFEKPSEFQKFVVLLNFPQKDTHKYCELFLFFFPNISRTSDLMPTKDLILFNHAEKMYQHHTVIAYLQTSVWYTSQLVDRDKGKGPISQGYWLTVTHWNLFHSLPEIFFSIFYIFILFVHQKQWVKRSLKYAFKN